MSLRGHYATVQVLHASGKKERKNGVTGPARREGAKGSGAGSELGAGTETGMGSGAGTGTRTVMGTGVMERRQEWGWM